MLVVHAQRGKPPFHASSRYDLSGAPLYHRHETTWWRECFFLDDWLPRLDEVLDRGSLMAMLHCVWWRIRCIVSHGAYDRLLRSHLLLKRLAEPKEFPALDEEMC
jgi:hypothetical protein